MQAVRSKDTAPEVALRRALRERGARGYRVNVKRLPGCPDVVFGNSRVAVFVDGAFWHGRPDRLRPGRSTYWDHKITRNADRDLESTLALREKGWRVLRLWDDEVLSDPDDAADRVMSALGCRPAAEFFAGIGLMRLGLEQAGFNVRFANDIDRSKAAVYRSNFDDCDTFALDDIRHIRGVDVPEVALASASFPCTDLSLAGSRRGLNGSESSTFWEFTRIVDEMGDRKPPVLFIENVSGFRLSDAGRDLVNAIRELNRLGYVCDILQIDARGWVPQSRARVFIVAFQQPLIAPDSWRVTSVRPAWIAAFASCHRDLLLQPARLPEPPSTTWTLRHVVERLSPTDSRWWAASEVRRFIRSLAPIQAKRLRILEKTDSLLWRTAYRRTRGGVARWEIRNDEIAGCLRTTRGGSSRQALVEVDAGDVRIRWMLPMEYARLMGAPQIDLSSVSVNKALSALGDAVCVPAVEWLARNYLVPLVDGLLTVQPPPGISIAVNGNGKTHHK